MCECNNDYQTIIAHPTQTLGVGLSGHVFVVDNESVAKVAVPTGQTFHDTWRLESIELEVKIYERLGAHNRICQLKRVIPRGLVLQRHNVCLRTRLRELRETSAPRLHSAALRWSTQAIQAYEYIHSKGVLHSDIGCHNILLDANDNVVLCDFASSAIDGSEPFCWPNPGFERPAEDKTSYCLQDELFAIGSTIYEIWTYNQPFEGEFENDPRSEDIALERFRQKQFPDLRGLPSARIIYNCWIGAYQCAKDISQDLEQLALQVNALLEFLFASSYVIKPPVTTLRVDVGLGCLSQPSTPKLIAEYPPQTSQGSIPNIRDNLDLVCMIRTEDFELVQRPRKLSRGP